MHTLIKLAQSYDVFLCYFIDAVKVCQLYFYHLYFESYTKFGDLAFDEFKTFELLISKNLSMSWCKDLNDEEVDCLIIEFVGAKFFVNQDCLATSVLKHVLRPYFLLVMVHPKSSCEDSTQALVLVLEVKFSNHEFMLALGVVYLNF
jgi:hypothetical protein